MSWIPLAMMAASTLANSLGSKSSTWSGEKAKIHKLGTLTSEQKHLLNKLVKHPNVKLPKSQNDPMYQQGGDFLSKILSQDPKMMQQFEAPMKRQFEEEIVPGLTQRFSGLGARNSSAFNQAMAQAGSGLSERIAAMRAGLGLGATNQAFGYSQLPFQQASENERLNLARMGVGLGVPAFGYQATGGTPGIGSGLSSGLMQGGLEGLFSGAGADGGGLFSGLGNLFSSIFGGGGGGSRGSTSWGSGYLQ